jgi:hypothetical protein
VERVTERERDPGRYGLSPQLAMSGIKANRSLAVNHDNYETSRLC